METEAEALEMNVDVGNVEQIQEQGQISQMDREADKIEGQPTESAATKLELAKLKVKNQVMCNPLVLDKITNSLLCKTLRDLRSTCTVWNQNFIPELKKKHEPIELSACVAYRQRRPVDLYSQVMGESNEIPFAKFKFNQFHRGVANETFSISSGRIFNFVSEFGNSLTSLNLHWCCLKVLTVPELWRIIFEMTPNLTDLNLELEDFQGQGQGGGDEQPAPESSKINETGGMKSIPNLKRLETWSESSSGNMSPAFVALVAEILQSAPNLESLTLDDNVDEEYVPVCLNALQGSEAIKTLKALKLYVLDSGNLKVLVRLGSLKENALCLETFTSMAWACPFEYPENIPRLREEAQLLCDFLTTQSRSLRALNLEVNDSDVEMEHWRPITNVPNFRIPKLERLTKLELKYADLEFIKVRYGDSDGDGTFSGTFPRLQTFTHGGNRDLDDNFMELSHPGVTSLDVSGVRCILFQDNLRQLTTLYPAVLKQTCYWSNVEVPYHKISRLWTLWPALTHLHAQVAFREDTTPDEFLSGVPRASLQDLQRELDALPKPPTRGSLCVLLCRYKMRPALVNLRQLKELKLEFTLIGPDPPNHDLETVTETRRVTDLGGYFGLAVASYHLQHLEIRATPKNEVSEECLAFIREALPLYAVIEL